MLSARASRLGPQGAGLACFHGGEMSEDVAKQLRKAGTEHGFAVVTLSMEALARRIQLIEQAHVVSGSTWIDGQVAQQRHGAMWYLLAQACLASTWAFSRLSRSSAVASSFPVSMYTLNSCS